MSLSILTDTSGRMPASSHASRELSTASLIPIRRDLERESNPRICLFFSKNSVTEISCCLAASLWAMAVFLPPGSAASFFESSEGIRAGHRGSFI